MADNGTPILGDKLYGMSETEYNTWRDAPAKYKDLEFPRQALHCSELLFKFRNEEFHIKAEMMSDMKELLNK